MAQTNKHSSKSAHQSDRRKTPKGEKSRRAKSGGSSQKAHRESQASFTPAENTSDANAPEGTVEDTTTAQESAGGQQMYYYVPRPWESFSNDSTNAATMEYVSPMDGWLNESEREQPWHAMEGVYIDATTSGDFEGAAGNNGDDGTNDYFNAAS